MYSRERGDRTYTFEASGGLLHAGLVMRDRETDSWWSIINEEAIHGPAEGQRAGERLEGSVAQIGFHPLAPRLALDRIEAVAEIDPLAGQHSSSESPPSSS